MPPGLAIQHRYLAVQVDSDLCAISLLYVAEIMRPLPVETVFGLPSFVLGLALIRGSPVPVVSLSEVLKGTTGGEIGRFVLLRVGERAIALAVKNVLGAVVINETSFGDLPPLLQNAKIDVIEKVGVLDSQLAVLLTASRLLTEEHWQFLSGGKAVQ